MTGHQGVRFVRGFVEGVDDIPARAKKIGFQSRLAFALSTYRVGEVDLLFDDDLYLALVGAISSAVGCDEFRVEPSDPQEKISLAGLRSRLKAEPETEREPFELLEAVHKGRVCAVIVSEPWARVGGPDPYHDSYVAAVFSDEELLGKIEGEARAACERLGAEIVETIAASPLPKHSIGARVKRVIDRALR
jgi:hypothetical protein